MEPGGRRLAFTIVVSNSVFATVERSQPTTTSARSPDHPAELLKSTPGLGRHLSTRRDANQPAHQQMRRARRSRLAVGTLSDAPRPIFGVAYSCWAISRLLHPRLPVRLHAARWASTTQGHRTPSRRRRAPVAYSSRACKYSATVARATAGGDLETGPQWLARLRGLAGTA